VSVFLEDTSPQVRSVAAVACCKILLSEFAFADTSGMGFDLANPVRQSPSYVEVPIICAIHS
jgi:hypothetical protein